MKRLFDIVCSLAGLIVLFPVFILLYFIISIKMGTPVLFKQERPGKDEKAFFIYKYRTMSNEKDEQGNLKPNHIRLTKFGRFLRSTSMDELPELFNVLKGEMSLVGPRPLRMHYLPRYNEHQKRRHEVRPGITGYAQINGRNRISWEEKFDMDVWYVDNQTFLLDIQILFSTIFRVLKRDGVSQSEQVTMPEFKGTENQKVKQ